VEVAIGDGSKREAGLGGIVQVRAHGGEVDERHFDGSNWALPAAVRRTKKVLWRVAGLY
jgi:hypothetical protein